MPKAATETSLWCQGAIGVIHYVVLLISNLGSCLTEILNFLSDSFSYSKPD